MVKIRRVESMCIKLYIVRAMSIYGSSNRRIGTLSFYSPVAGLSPKLFFKALSVCAIRDVLSEGDPQSETRVWAVWLFNLRCHNNLHIIAEKRGHMMLMAISCTNTEDAKIQEVKT